MTKTTTSTMSKHDRDTLFTAHMGLVIHILKDQLLYEDGTRPAGWDELLDSAITHAWLAWERICGKLPPRKVGDLVRCPRWRARLAAGHAPIANLIEAGCPLPVIAERRGIPLDDLTALIARWESSDVAYRLRLACIDGARRARRESAAWRKSLARRDFGTEVADVAFASAPRGYRDPEDRTIVESWIDSIPAHVGYDNPHELRFVARLLSFGRSVEEVATLRGYCLRKAWMVLDDLRRHVDGLLPSPEMWAEIALQLGLFSTQDSDFPAWEYTYPNVPAEAVPSGIVHENPTIYGDLDHCRAAFAGIAHGEPVELAVS